MSLCVWKGGNTNTTQQVTTATVGGTLAGQTFTISAKHPSGIGSAVAIASFADTDTMVGTVATALAAAWNASNHAYATPVSAAAVAGVVTFTSDLPGIPFVITLNTPGGSTTFVLATTTANYGPNDYSDPSNWVSGAVPTGSDNVRISTNNGQSFAILYGLAQSGVAINAFTRCKEHTANVGWIGAPLTIDPDVFTWDGGGIGHVDIGSANIPVLIVGTGSGVPYGLSIIGSNITTTQVDGGVVAIAYAQGETATIGTLLVNQGSTVIVGSGASITNIKVCGGTLLWRGGQTLAVLDSDYGNITLEGTATITALTNAGAKIVILKVGAITTGNFADGLTDCTMSKAGFTIGTATGINRALSRNDSVTITTNNLKGSIGLGASSSGALK